jgi:hypothetical protein
MMGHTDKATINQRRPLTDNMLEVLRTLADRLSIYATTPPRRGLYPREMTQAEKNAAKALDARGMAKWGNGYWQITDAGIGAVQRVDRVTEGQP